MLAALNFPIINGFPLIYPGFPEYYLIVAAIFYGF